MPRSDEPVVKGLPFRHDCSGCGVEFKVKNRKGGNPEKYCQDCLTKIAAKVCDVMDRNDLTTDEFIGMLKLVKP